MVLIRRDSNYLRQLRVGLIQSTNQLLYFQKQCQRVRFHRSGGDCCRACICGNVYERITLCCSAISPQNLIIRALFSATQWHSRMILYAHKTDSFYTCWVVNQFCFMHGMIKEMRDNNSHISFGTFDWLFVGIDPHTIRTVATRHISIATITINYYGQISMQRIITIAELSHSSQWNIFDPILYDNKVRCPLYQHCFI